ncbi:hypothetical protein AVV13_gp45 [Streptomyces phage SF1]|uniref:Uncharacterized protein n=1 Tax=Streptomyces phage SF1 TaxID=1690817 RepID=A0A0K1Y5C2_9CAUD|nr:hypothetical protein AVV13_gp45 [Streptomyces phage SF1]AKY02194.1 hypothetical protein SF1_450 [Streptomyces phage SF1]
MERVAVGACLPVLAVAAVGAVLAVLPILPCLAGRTGGTRRAGPACRAVGTVRACGPVVAVGAVAPVDSVAPVLAVLAGWSLRAAAAFLAGGARHGLDAIRQILDRPRGVRRRWGAALGLDLLAQHPHVGREGGHCVAAPSSLGAEPVGPACFGVDPQPHEQYRTGQDEQHRGEHE